MTQLASITGIRPGRIVVAYLDGLSGNTHLGPLPAQASIVCMRRVPDVRVGALISRLVAIADSHELRHLKPLSRFWPHPL